ncbi:SulP family inorganic anion transporter [Paracoccus sp. (in: a-proteobacteria)]|uniref:SulP family inorganic anion transporter n=1 Tax=Paracoccus sp. TaxID=267 RepID=UPI0028985C04|nr:SulP family inorganic anion transporter [Paracoccus sp. (in: a-proteobacteria)]
MTDARPWPDQRQDCPSRHAEPDLPLAKGHVSGAVTGFLMGIDTLGECLALASLCFAGSVLMPGLGLGTTLFLLSCCVAAILTAKFSRISNAIATAQDASIAVLAATMALAAQTAQDLGPAVQLATAFAVLGGSTMASGAALWLVGRFGLARYARLLPYSVISGFLAACGFLLVIAAVEMVWQNHATIGLAPLALGVLLPGIVLALALTASLALGGPAHNFLLILLAAVVLYWVVHFALGLDFAQSAALGYLPQLGTDGPAQAGLSLAAFREIPSNALAVALPGGLAVVVINVIAAILNIAGIELETRREIDLDRELRLAAGANLIIGGFGGLASYIDSPTTAIVEKLGLRSRAVGFGYALVTLIGCAFAAQLVQIVPIYVSFGMLLFIGLGMMKDWLWDLRRQIALREWLVIIGILIMAVGLGLLTAIVAGLALAMAGFAVEYAKSPVIRSQWNGTGRRSSYDRAPGAQAILAREGAAIQGLGLQGYLYFGSVDTLSKAIRNLSWQCQGQATLILDFSAVTGIDGAACAAFDKLFQTLREAGIFCAVTGLSPLMTARFQSWNPDFAKAPRLQVSMSLDDALERAEDRLLASLPPGLQDHAETFPPAALLPLFQTIMLARDETLIAADATGTDVFVLQSGRLGIYLPAPTGLIRVRSLGPGALVGELALYTGAARSALVRADSDCKVLVLPDRSIAALETQDPAAALLLHRALAAAISDKLLRTNALLRHL